MSKVLFVLRPWFEAIRTFPVALLLAAPTCVDVRPRVTARHHGLLDEVT